MFPHTFLSITLILQCRIVHVSQEHVFGEEQSMAVLLSCAPPASINLWETAWTRTSIFVFKETSVDCLPAESSARDLGTFSWPDKGFVTMLFAAEPRQTI